MARTALVLHARVSRCLMRAGSCALGEGTPSFVSRSAIA
jgi:hypothetical protein